MEDEWILENLMEVYKSNNVGNPIFAELRLTNRCNLNCIMCSQSKSGENELSDTEWIKIAEQLLDMNCKVFLIFSEGEPLIRKKLFLKIAHLAKNNSRSTHTVTNGTLIDRESADELINMKFDMIRISIDGPDSDSHDRIRGSGSWKKIIENIEYINYQKKKMNSFYPTINLGTIMNKYLIGKFRKHITLAKRLNIRTIQFLPLLIDELGSGNPLKISITKDIMNEIRSAMRLSDKIGVNTNLNDFLTIDWFKNPDKQKIERRYHKNNKNTFKSKFLECSCYHPWYFISIRTSGYVTPCHTINEEICHYSVGLEKIWTGKFFQNVRKIRP